MSTYEVFNNCEVNLFDFTSKEIATLASSQDQDNIWIMGAPILWKQNINGLGCKIGVIDTGIDNNHPDLKTNVILRRDYVKDGLTSNKFNDHGTHVAGIIAANGLLKGIAPKASLIDYRVLNVQGSGSYDWIVQAIRDAIKDGCNIINMSLGGFYDYAPLRGAIQEAVKNNILVVVAAGNAGPNSISYPAYYQEVVSVGAINYDKTTGNITLPSTPWFSTSNMQVDVAADGWHVLSTMTNGRYAALTGTSMAAPHVSGYAALMWDKYRKRMRKSPSEVELYAEVKSSTVDILVNGVDIVAGAGLVTSYPELPKKIGDIWTLPSMNL